MASVTMASWQKGLDDRMDLEWFCPIAPLLVPILNWLSILWGFVCVFLSWISSLNWRTK